MNRRSWLKTLSKGIAGAVAACVGLKAISAPSAKSQIYTIHLHSDLSEAALYGKRAARSVVRGKLILRKPTIRRKRLPSSPDQA